MRKTSIRYVAICGRFDEYLKHNAVRNVSNAELARVCEVNVRTLHNALVVTGHSLKEYMTLHRLWAVRSALCCAAGKQLVKTIAIDHGFWHLGRFSTLYSNT